MSGNLSKSLSTIYGVLSCEIDHNDLEAVKQKLSDMQAVIGLSGACVAESERLYLLRKESAAASEYAQGMSATRLKMYVDAEASEAQKLVRQAERYNAALTHSMDAMRSLLSYAKEEMRYLE